MSVKSLSKREIEVYYLLKKGYTSTRIADKLNVDSRTVHTFLNRMRTKTHQHNGNLYTLVVAIEELDLIPERNE